MNNDYILSSYDQKQFRDWLDLNINNITWEGRYGEEFNAFWEGLFCADVSPSDQIDKIEKAVLLVSSGPIISWFNWLKSKYLCYLYIFKNFTLLELSQTTSESPKSLAVTLRDFFVERYPHMEERFNVYFQVSHVTCDKINLSFEDIVSELGISKEILGTIEDDILKNLEVTLYKDWALLKEKISLNNSRLEESIKNIKKKTTVKKQVRFIQELLVLFIIGGFFIVAVKFGNEWYEKKLVKEITLFEPNFFWLDKGLNYQVEDPLSEKGIKLSHKELDELEKLESNKIFETNVEARRYDVESDVVLTSLDTLPKNFTSADLEKSIYEENRKGGYRDVRYGGRRAYRVMMTSESPNQTKLRLINLLKKYNVKQVDNVKPGTEIPGGIYFNLHVPRKVLKEFLSNVSSVRESRILESKTVFGGPRGTSKVFIWIKQI